MNKTTSVWCVFKILSLSAHTMAARAGFYEFYRATDEDPDFPWIDTRRPIVSSIVENIHVGSSTVVPLEPEPELPRIPRTRRITAPTTLRISDDDEDEDMDEDWVDDRFGMSDDEEVDLTENNEIIHYDNEQTLSDNEL